ncbi:MAG: GIY-YIG nuclease family protein [Patescibacteria group bacterium]
MYHTYILKSKKNNQYYVGYTNDLNARLELHNVNLVPATKGLGPWEIFHSEQFQTEKEAVHRERQIKSWKSRRAIERLKFKQNRGSAIFNRDNIEITTHAEENKKPGK